MTFEKLLKFKLDTSYNEQSKNSDNPKFSLTYGNKINDTMGHILGITYASKQIVTYNNETGFPGWEIEDGNKETGTILQEIQSGYMIGERLLRPALVAVAKRKEEKKDQNEKKQSLKNNSWGKIIKILGGYFPL